ncbi:sigma factor [Fontivita pretiosa]|uniref:sigma factor n=1 Tax=Fontivita pretiosa TaxID=2989684 RepID=UPI003D172839
MAAALHALAVALAGRYRHIDETIRHDAAIDAILKLIERPERFDRSRGVTLEAFLFKVAANRLLNLRRGELRLKRRERAAADPNHTGPSLRHVAKDPLEVYIAGEQLQRCLAMLDNSQEVAFVKLLADGEQDVGRLIQALGLEHLPVEQWRRELKRARDRIRIKLKRKGAGR